MGEIKNTSHTVHNSKHKANNKNSKITTNAANITTAQTRLNIDIFLGLKYFLLFKKNFERKVKKSEGHPIRSDKWKLIISDHAVLETVSAMPIAIVSEKLPSVKTC